jgi:hypothetical protein
MKYLNLFILFLVIAACQNVPQQTTHQAADKAVQPTGNFGKEVLTEQAVAAEDIAALFGNADSVEVTVFGNISASCKHSGCWMDLDMGGNEAIHVTFVDESFTIPLDAAGKNAIAQGIAVRELVPVEKLQNYAREDGKSEAEIAAITEPVYLYEFVANGVLIQE